MLAELKRNRRTIAERSFLGVHEVVKCRSFYSTLSAVKIKLSFPTIYGTVAVRLWSGYIEATQRLRIFLLRVARKNWPIYLYFSPTKNLTQHNNLLTSWLKKKKIGPKSGAAMAAPAAAAPSPLYFSDGAASQYKNCKNVVNLCHHEEDFGISAEWHFCNLSW